MATKVISRKAAKAKGLLKYFTGMPCRHGHVAERHVSSKGCMECLRLRNAAARERDPEPHRKAVRKWRRNHPDEVLRGALITREQRKIRYRDDPNYRLGILARTRLSKIARGGNRFISDFGCTFDQMKVHIESLFKPGMTWKNRGKVWEIDHIKPLLSFDLTVRDQFLLACHYTNLQPLVIDEHREKSQEEILEWRTFLREMHAPQRREVLRKNRVKRGNSRKRQSRRKPSRAT